MRRRPVVEVHAVERADGEARWLSRLGAADGARYEDLVRPHVVAIRCATSADLSPGWAADRPALHEARHRWRSRLAAHAATGAWMLATDVASCYASITTAAIAAGLADVGARMDDDLATFLRAMAAAGAPGLPIGPSPSVPLADAVLALGDRAARRSGAAVLRWVDDVVFVTGERRAALRAFDAWRETLGRVGLRPNEGKTRWLTVVSEVCGAMREGFPSHVR